MSGTAKVNINEIDKTQRVSGQSTASVGGVIPSVRGPLVPTLVSNNTSFYKAYTPEGIFNLNYDNSYLEIEQYLNTAGSLFLSRAYINPMYAGALVYSFNSAKNNQGISVSISNPSDFVFTTNNGRPLVVDSEITFNSVNDTFESTALFYNGSFTGDKVNFSRDTADVFPPEILLLTDYYLIKTSTPNTFKIASSKLNALDGVNLTLSDNGTGVSFTVSNLEVFIVPSNSNNSSFTVDSANDVVLVSTDFYNSSKTGDPVICSKGSTDTFPAEILESTTYYLIKTSTVNQMKLATSSLNATSGVFINFSGTGTGSSFVVTNSNITVPNIYNQPVALIYAKDPGDWGNLLQIKITNYDSNKILVKEPNCFAIEVYYNNKNTGELFICSFDPLKKNKFGVSMYISEMLKTSNYISALVNPAITDPLTTLKENIITPLTFVKGVSDTLIDETALIKALQPFRNVKKYNIQFLCDFGITLPAFQKEIIDICESRGDCAFIISVPYSAFLSPTTYLNDILAYKNTTLNSVSNYGALYANPLLIADSQLGRRVWITPSGIMASKHVAMWDSGQPWGVVAGNKIPLNVLDVAKYFEEDEESILVDNGINPIRFEEGSGIKPWGERTLQIAPTAFDRMHVRILFNYLKPAIKAALEPFLFLLNDINDQDSIMSTMTDILNQFLDVVKGLNGIYDYEVICNSTNNTVNDIVNSTVNIDIYVSPVYSIEKINVGVIATNNFITFTN